MMGMSLFKNWEWLLVMGTGIILAVSVSFGWNESLPVRILLALYVMLAGYMIGRRSIASEASDAIFLSPLLISLIFTIGGAVIFYFFQFNTTSTIMLLFLPALFACIGKKKKEKSLPVSLSWRGATLLSLSLLLSISTTLILFYSQTLQTTLGPWEAVHPLFFLCLFLNSCLILTAVFLRASGSSLLVSITAFFFSFISALAFVYPLGFGFDPILHTAAQTLLVDQGFITPKTPYYSGQYGLAATLSILFKVHPEILQRFFIVGLTALTLPFLIYRTALTFGFSRTVASFGSFASFTIIPLSSLASLTPWGYAFLGSIITILASVLFLNTKNKGWMILLLTSFVATLTIHPLAGLPIIGFILTILLFAYRPPHWIVEIFFFLFSILSIPAAFTVLSFVSPQLPLELKSFNLQTPLSLIKQFIPSLESRFSALLDPTYCIASALGLLLLVLAINGMIILYRQPQYRKIFRLLCFGFAGAIGSYVLTRGFLFFPSLPQYEQGIYANRIQEIAMLFLVPGSIISLCSIGRRLQRVQRKFLLFSFVLIVSSILVIRVYTLYPRNDAFVAYHGYTISKNDIEAVKWIEADAAGEEYIVLANQVVSAASIKTFGFKKYYTAPIDGKPATLFYYSIPATSPLHAAFVQMLHEPSRETIELAMNLAGVERAYFVVNKYEPRFRNTLEKAKKTADDFYSIDTDTVTIFQYLKPDPSSQ